MILSRRLDYCRSDVDILRRACMRYRDLLIKATSDEGCARGVDPFQHITIASVAMAIFKTRFLSETWSVKLNTGATITATKLNGQFKVDNVLLSDYLGPAVNIVAKSFVKSPIAYLPSEGYTRQNQYSNISIQCEKSWQPS